jgi:hypothetical protein
MPVSFSHDEGGLTMPHKIWTVGEEMLAADVNDYLQEQVVATFANHAARIAAITAPVAGQMTWLTDQARVEQYDGTKWVPIEPPTFRHDGQVSNNNSGGAFVKSYLNIDYANLGKTLYCPFTMIVDVSGWMSTTAAHNWDVRDEGGTSIRLGVISNWAFGSGATAFNIRGKKNYAAGATCGYSVWWLTNAASYFGANTRVELVPQ